MKLSKLIPPLPPFWPPMAAFFLTAAVGMAIACRTVEVATDGGRLYVTQREAGGIVLCALGAAIAVTPFWLRAMRRGR